MKNKPFITGIIAAATPIDLFIISILWSWICCFGIGMGILNYDRIPMWLGIFSLLPMLISPALGILGLVHSFIKIKAKLSWLGILLSCLCLVENFLLFTGMLYLGSRY